MCKVIVVHHQALFVSFSRLAEYMLEAYSYSIPSHSCRIRSRYTLCPWSFTQVLKNFLNWFFISARGPAMHTHSLTVWPLKSSKFSINSGPYIICMTILLVTTASHCSLLLLALFLLLPSQLLSVALRVVELPHLLHSHLMNMPVHNDQFYFSNLLYTCQAHRKQFYCAKKECTKVLEL